MTLSRRHLLVSTVATGVTACASPAVKSTKPSQGHFAHGIASGDPQSDGFVIWTRVTPYTESAEVLTSWDVALDSRFQTLVKTGSIKARPTSDWTVKIELKGLEPGTSYYYRFKTTNSQSQTGRTKTLPVESLPKARFAVVSCSNYPFGFFNVYDHISQQDDLDAVIHLGDYIYEYGQNSYGGDVGAKIGRNHLPATEILSLSDYRERHAQYKMDAASQKMLAKHPLIAIWDDHETANNSWQNSAENHQEDEGPWTVRRDAALQAYYEWMPVRNPKPGKLRESLFSNYQWADLIDLSTLETRLTARSEQLEYADIIPTINTAEDIEYFKRDVLGAADRLLMGKDQSAYLKQTFTASKSANIKWQLIANQVIMANVASPNLVDLANDPAVDAIEKVLPKIRDFLRFTALGLPLNLDAWDGYPAARERLYAMATEAGRQDLLVLTGDTHEYWVNNLYRDNGQKMGVELGVSGVTSPGGATYFGSKAKIYSERLVAANSSVIYHDPFQKGYIDLVITPEKADVKFVAMSTVLSETYTGSISARFDIQKSQGTLDVSKYTN